MSARVARGLALLALSLAAARASGQEAELLAEESAGIVPVTVERRVDVSGIHGEIVVAGRRDAREIRFEAVSASDPSVDVPVALWSEGTTLRFRPLGGAEVVEADLEIEVPESTFVTIEAERSRVSAHGLGAGLELRGREVDFDGTYLSYGASIELQGGSVRIEGCGGQIVVRGGGLAVSAKLLSGDVYLSFGRGTAKLEQITGRVEADLEEVGFEADGVSGPAVLRARGGKVALKRCLQGASAYLSGTLFQADACKGRFDVESDAAVRLEQLDGEVHLSTAGGSVLGRSVRGPFTIEAKAAIAVRLENALGPVSVSGTGLTVDAKDVAGDFTADLIDSGLVLEGAGGAVAIANDGGDVSLKNARGEVKVTSRGGSVSLSELTGPVEIQADGPAVEVSWTTAPNEKDSKIENEGGDVTVRILGGGCRVEAESRRGRVESSIPTVVAVQGSGSAQGTIGGAHRPTVFVEAEGDVFLLAGGGE